MNSEEEAFAAIEKLHQTGTKTVVLSSSTLGSKGVLLCLASTAVSELYQLDLGVCQWGGGGGGGGITPLALWIQGHFLCELCQCGLEGWGRMRGNTCCCTWNPSTFLLELSVCVGGGGEVMPAVAPGIRGHFLLQLCKCCWGGGEYTCWGNFLHKLYQCGSGRWGGVRGNACCYTWNPRAFPTGTLSAWWGGENFCTLDPWVSVRLMGGGGGGDKNICI